MVLGAGFTHVEEMPHDRGDLEFIGFIYPATRDIRSKAC